MADNWENVKAETVRPGDVVRHRGNEFEVSTIEESFLGRDAMIAFIEDSPERWNKYPAARDADVEVRRSA